ncbi:ATP-binding protein [Listeria booriae]|uniref:ATP-binding protein n=1 Tax=Listeria booriae TaxID=1552123 RepID=UPI001627FE18|nr:ATP-binding protein [Listeria booriae]MBC1800796.1 ATP-binding protein [Listeria booriae]MBC1803762.1 ATP-binding protein [Listeria booriae]
MATNNLEIGIVTEVSGFKTKIATFDNSNHANFITDGELIKNVSVNSFILIGQGFVKIVARVTSESIWDMQNDLKSFQLDNRFSKESIKRILEVQTIGYIKNNRFISGASYLPMIGNNCFIPNSKEVNQIYINNYATESEAVNIRIGQSLSEENQILLPVNLFFASHIGVFGNTGSGKSNTLHKLFYELFSLKKIPRLREISKFLVLDFNGEYIHKNSFGIFTGHEKKVYELSSKVNSTQKFPIKKSTFFSTEVLAMLFSATPQTQQPFLSRILSAQRKYGSGLKSLTKWIKYLIKEIYINTPNPEHKNYLVSVLEDYFKDIPLTAIKETELFRNSNCYRYSGTYFNSDWNDDYEALLNITEIIDVIKTSQLNSFQEFEIRCKLQLLNDWLYGNIVPEHITPLIKRVESRLDKICNYVELTDAIPEDFLQIVSLRELDQEAKKFISILVCKMYFEHHKKSQESSSFHLIIDEAHNILSNESVREESSWKDYRLELFEEIIKEGRKFSFFLTISSQRPADISHTILSQIHNFFLHKLVNERDLQIIDTSISTLDKISKSMLPVLSQGVCIISGTALSMPITVVIDFISDISIRPNSDTIRLTDVWC